MTQQPDHPGTETHVAKPVVAGAQAALDATFNAHANGPLDDVAGHLRDELDRAGVGDGLSQDWVARAAARIEAGEPVVAEPDDAATS